MIFQAWGNIRNPAGLGLHFNQAICQEAAKNLRKVWVDKGRCRRTWVSEPVHAIVTVPARVESELKRVRSNQTDTVEVSQ